MSSRYVKPKLEGHRILYNGKRYMAFEVSKEFPFQLFEDFCDIVVYDKAMEFVGSTCKKQPNGSFKCSYPYGPHDLDTSGDTIREVAQRTYLCWLETWDK